MPKLEELYLANNNNSSLNGYEGLGSLRILHLRRNKIDKIDDEIPELPALEYLNLRSNKIPDMKNLEKLFVFPNLKDINVINCPVELSFSSMNVFIAEILIKNPKISRFCKIDITDSHKLEAVFLAKFQNGKAEEEKKRLEEEEKAKEAADAAANEG